MLKTERALKNPVFILNYLPCIEYNWRKEVYEEKVLAENKNVGAFSFCGHKNDHSSTETLQ